MRFVFGGLVSVVCGFIGAKFGVLMGGLFLAFPSILPATLTLVNDHDGKGETILDAKGAIFGSVGLLVFSLVAWFLARLDIAVPAVLAAALVAWAFAGLLVWRFFSSPSA